jgi:hypothetical protein
MRIIYDPCADPKNGGRLRDSYEAPQNYAEGKTRIAI